MTMIMLTATIMRTAMQMALSTSIRIPITTIMDMATVMARGMRMVTIISMMTRLFTNMRMATWIMVRGLPTLMHQA